MRPAFVRSALRGLFVASLATLALSGCAHRPAGSHLGPEPLAQAGAAGFERLTLRAGPFTLTALQRGPVTAARTVVYIEGDGAAWRGRASPPRDPTPDYPLALALALRDGAERVVWLARPCQFLAPAALADCPSVWWTRERYAEPAVAALDAVIDRLVGAGPTRLVLVGHSGGGTVAALLAARRRDVDGLVTLAANLDTGAWTTLHGVSPLAGSLNPAGFGARLGAVPQRHLVGARDDVVPASVVERYLAALDHPADARLEVVEGFDHQCCWERDWPRALLGVDDVSSLFTP